MELMLFIVAMFALGTVLFWVLGSVYGLIRTPAVYFPLSLAFKMAIAAILGAVALGFGGIIAATFVFHLEFKKRDDYNLTNGILVGSSISLVVSAILLLSAYGLAWQIFD